MDTEGRPVLVALGLRGLYEAEFVLATLSRTEEPTQPTYDSSSANGSRSNAKSGATQVGSYPSRSPRDLSGEPAAKRARIENNDVERVVLDKASEEMVFEIGEAVEESDLGLWTRPALVHDGQDQK